MSDPAIRFDPLPDATPEAELEMLAAVYSFLIERHENRKAAFRGGCVDNKEGGESEQSKAPSGSGGPSVTDRRGDGSDKPSKRTMR